MIRVVKSVTMSRCMSRPLILFVCVHRGLVRYRLKDVDFVLPGMKANGVRARLGGYALHPLQSLSFENIQHAWVSHRDVQMFARRVEEDHVRRAAQLRLCEHPA